MLRASKILCRCALVLALSVAAVSCGTKKAATGAASSSASLEAKYADTEAGRRNFVKKVFDNQVDANCISSKVKFVLNTGGKEMSISGSLKMKKDEVIRIQITPMGIMEVVRVEFTKDYVLLMNRMDKEYIKARYSDVGFLRENGLDFYALQAVFWNQLFIPGTSKLTESMLDKFDAELATATGLNHVTLEKGKIGYQWSADKTTGRIETVDMAYAGKSGKGARVECGYGSFKTIGAKQFPTDIKLSVTTNEEKGNKTRSLSLSLGSIDTGNDWETFTSVSGKYKEVELKDIVGRLLK